MSERHPADCLWSLCRQANRNGDRPAVCCHETGIPARPIDLLASALNQDLAREIGELAWPFLSANARRVVRADLCPLFELRPDRPLKLGELWNQQEPRSHEAIKSDATVGQVHLMPRPACVISWSAAVSAQRSRPTW